MWRKVGGLLCGVASEWLPVVVGCEVPGHPGRPAGWPRRQACAAVSALISVDGPAPPAGVTRRSGSYNRSRGVEGAEGAEEQSGSRAVGQSGSRAEG